MYRATEQAALPNPGDVPLLYLRCTEPYFFVGLTVRIGTPGTASTAFFKLLICKIPKASDKGAIIHHYSVNCVLPVAYERRSVHRVKSLRLRSKLSREKNHSFSLYNLSDMCYND